MNTTTALKKEAVMTKTDSTKKEPLILSIGGGKGGVGKSMVSSNLAVTYAQAGLKVTLLDLDFGAANIHTIFGIRQPKKSLGDYFTTPRSQLKEFLLDTKVENLKVAAGSGFIPELANLKHFQKTKLIKHIRKLDADVVLLDLGAGSSHNVIDFFSMTNGSIIVTTPEPTAIVNAYEFLKNVIYRLLGRMFRNQEKILNIIKESAIPNNSLNISSIDDLITFVRKSDPWIADQMTALCQDLDFYVVFNQARSTANAQSGKKLQQICKKYLHTNLNYSGMIFFNEEVTASVFNMMPMTLNKPNSVTSKSIQRIGTKIFNSLINKKLTGTHAQSFDEQLSQVMREAKQDHAKNLLTQKKIQRDRESKQTQDSKFTKVKS